MLKKTLLIVSFCAMHYINIKADHADDTWQKYNQKHHEAKEAHFKKERQNRLKKTASNVRLDDNMKNLLDHCLEGECGSCKELKAIMHQVLQKRKKNDDALFKEICENARKIDTILKDSFLSDAEKNELVGPLQEKTQEFKKKLNDIGIWNFYIGDIVSIPTEKRRPLIYEFNEMEQALLLNSFQELGLYAGKNMHDEPVISERRDSFNTFWNGKLDEVTLKKVDELDNVQSVCLRVPAPTFNMFIAKLLYMRIEKFINALEEIIGCDCKK